ncbi:LysE/ArgO family amino acid transporter [Roseateles sp.]|uniref:LysE/ArgO family amino acid transporter n=1 Tax=Roseateles sp. TaxID=1971397 RepID=UPI00286C19E9|nr:LysE family transporter [Roseateles sp.]
MPALPSIIFVEGFVIGFGLFSAIGPKDSLILQHGLSGIIIWRIVWLFVFADVFLIAVGMTGIGAYLEENKRAMSALLLGGGLYLVWFGAGRLFAALRDTSMPMELSALGASAPGLMRTAMVLAFANPYAWIDTVVIIGAIGGGKIQSEKLPFALGAMAASLVWFNALAYGSTRFRILFQTRLAWRALDTGTALMMFYLAAMLFLDVLNNRLGL